MRDRTRNQDDRDRVTTDLMVRTRSRSLPKLAESAHPDDPAECPRCRELAELRRDLHDEIGSALVGLKLQLELAQLSLHDGTDDLAELLTRAMTDVTGLVWQVRRLCSAHPGPARNGTDLHSALKGMVGRMNTRLSGRLHIELHLANDLGQLPADITSAAFMIVREALVNVIKHSGGNWCRLSVESAGNRLLLQVVDNGRGWSQPTDQSGHGLSNMRSRARELDGECLTGPGVPSGFVVAAWLPIHRSHDRASR
jgi:signal transduction histidine kinase